LEAGAPSHFFVPRPHIFLLCKGQLSFELSAPNTLYFCPSPTSTASPFIHLNNSTAESLPSPIANLPILVCDPFKPRQNSHHVLARYVKPQIKDSSLRWLTLAAYVDTRYVATMRVPLESVTDLIPAWSARARSTRPPSSIPKATVSGPPRPTSP
jgi:hypothetical protein